MSSPEEASPRIEPGAWLHFVGAGGSGMSALAQFHVGSGGIATGSDRAFDHGERGLLKEQLKCLGVEILKQDGDFPEHPTGRECTAVVVSTAIEDRVPDIRTAKNRGIPILHRSELLARYVTSHRTIAVSGTSGKSTVTGMVFQILREAGYSPGLLTGGPLAELTAEGHPGNAWAPGACRAEDGRPWLVIEADESDGSLIRYRPWAGVILNLGLDHKPPAEIMDMFRTFRENTQEVLVVAAESNLSELHEGADLFGLDPGEGSEGTWAREVRTGPEGSSFKIDGQEFRLDMPGRYNVLNAAASVAVCRRAGVDLETAASALAGFGGVARRFQSVGTCNGIEVIDDFAHNPDKIEAALGAARDRLGDRADDRRILAFFQPHGFGPTRFLRDELVRTFREHLRDQDVLWMPEIFFAGGTVTRDISAGELIEAIADRDGTARDARFIPERADIAGAMAKEAQPGDLVLVMGARDPSLTRFCGEILDALKDG